MNLLLLAGNVQLSLMIVILVIGSIVFNYLDKIHGELARIRQQGEERP